MLNANAAGSWLCEHLQPADNEGNWLCTMEREPGGLLPRQGQLAVLSHLASVPVAPGCQGEEDFVAKRRKKIIFV